MKLYNFRRIALEKAARGSVVDADLFVVSSAKMTEAPMGGAGVTAEGVSMPGMTNFTKASGSSHEPGQTGLADRDELPPFRGQLRQLARTIETEIVPRLMLSQAKTPEAPCAEESAQYAPPGAEEVAELARLTMHHEVCATRSFVDALRQRGVPVDAIFMDLVSPAARLLGQMWETDEATFADVTIGLSRLHVLTRELGRQFVDDFDMALGAHQAVLAHCPGEQHTLGLYILEAYFRRAGWDVWVLPSSRDRDLIHAVSRDWLRMLGLSIGTSEGIPAAKKLIDSVRRASLNKDLVVMVGGAAVLEHPECVEQIGATTWAASAREATEFMQRHVEADGTPAR